MPWGRASAVSFLPVCILLLLVLPHQSTSLPPKDHSHQVAGLTGLTNPVQADACTGLMQWVKESGAVADKVELQEMEGSVGLGLVASADIARGDPVMSVPTGLLFPTRVSTNSIAVQILKKAEAETIGRILALCVYLMAEKADKQSFWQPWIRTLPQQFFHALSFSDQDMHEFQASAFSELRSRKRANLDKEYVDVIEPLVAAVDFAAEGTPQGVTREMFSKEAFEWAYSVVTTRAVFPQLLSEMERVGDVPLILLGPLTDSLAHGVGAVSISYDAEMQHVKFTALEEIKKGARVSVGCGLTSNLELLANRGTVLPANRNNFVLIKFQLDPKSDMHAGARQEMMKQLNLTSPMTYIVRGGEMPQGLLTSLRIQSLTPVEFSFFQKAASAPVSLENEWRAYRLLISSCNTILNQYKTTIEDDDSLLKAGTLGTKMTFAVMLRRQEKMVYDSIKAWAHDAWSSLLYATASTSSGSTA